MLYCRQGTILYVTDRVFFEKNGFQNDKIDPKTKEILLELGLEEEMENTFSGATEETEVRLSKIGFEKSKDFEKLFKKEDE